MDMKNLWQPFSQVDNSSTRRFGGTGLGLSISLSLVRLMGGDIGVSSKLNHGSCFWFYVPVRVQDSEETRKVSLGLSDYPALSNLQYEQSLEDLRQKLREPRPLRILISSPSSVTLSLLTTLLAGFDVESVDSAELAIERLRNAMDRDAELDFIILDHFGQTQLQQISGLLDGRPVFANTKAIHLYTPTPLVVSPVGGLLHKPGLSQSISHSDGNIDMALASATGFASTQRQDGGSRITSFGRVVRMNKPARRARLLQLLANLKDVSISAGELTGTQIERALESLEAVQGLLATSNALIAEGVCTIEMQEVINRRDRQSSRQQVVNETTAKVRCQCDFHAGRDGGGEGVGKPSCWLL